MKRSIYCVAVFLLLGIFSANYSIDQANAGGKHHHHKPKPTPRPTPRPTPKPTPKPPDCSVVENKLATCNENLDTCIDDLAECESQPNNVFPGDGYVNPDTFGVSGHGPALSYTDNNDGTFTDNNTGFMWEIKLADNDIGGNCADVVQANRNAHCVNNIYTWSGAFTEFLDDINNTCDGAGMIPCTDDSECGAGLCGLAGYQDWHLPNIKQLMSIVDYSKENPASVIPGFIQPSHYWSATTDATLSSNAWYVRFDNGIVFVDNKNGNFNYARAVRP